MTVEPVQECLRCGTTLERNQQGAVLWCTRCQLTWNEGFQEGLRAYRDLMSLSDMRDVDRLIESKSPYMVRR